MFLRCANPECPNHSARISAEGFSGIYCDCRWPGGAICNGLMESIPERELGILQIPNGARKPLSANFVPGSGNHNGRNGKRRNGF